MPVVYQVCAEKALGDSGEQNSPCQFCFVFCFKKKIKIGRVSPLLVVLVGFDVFNKAYKLQ